MSVAPPPTPEPRAIFDPGAEVPSAYDVFCEGCSYSLVGIVADRCPECGRRYDPTALPFARIPWLHRRRLGRWAAYWSTVWMIMWRPWDFARELCRPVRISAADARTFRRITLRLTVWSFVLGPIAAAGVLYGFALGSMTRIPTTALQVWGLAYVAFYVGLRILFGIGTDIPVFIWKGLPGRPPGELAPIHHYASAPLAFSPLLVAAMVGLFFISQILPPAAVPAELVAAGLVLVMAFAVWTVPVTLMRAATGCGVGRSAALLAFLPLHWLMALLLVGVGWTLIYFLMRLYRMI